MDTKEGFDLRTTIRDPKSGKTVKEQYWTGHFNKSGEHVFERDGKFYYENGQEAPNPKAATAVVTPAVKEDKKR